MPTTKENLNEAFAGESQANQKYRAFAKKAERDGFPNIAKLFNTTAEAGKDLKETEFYLCPVCGHIEFGKPKDNCPICGTLASKYVKVS